MFRTGNESRTFSAAGSVAKYLMLKRAFKRWFFTPILVATWDWSVTHHLRKKKMEIFALNTIFKNYIVFMICNNIYHLKHCHQMIENGKPLKNCRIKMKHTFDVAIWRLAKNKDEGFAAKLLADDADRAAKLSFICEVVTENPTLLLAVDNDVTQRTAAIMRRWSLSACATIKEHRTG